MSLLHAAFHHSAPNPLDETEQMLIERDISYERPCDHEVLADTEGQWCNYRLWFNFDDSVGVLVFSCAFDLRIPPKARETLYPLLVKLNEKLWLGHFDMTSEDGTILFRHSLLTQTSAAIKQDQLGALLEIATSECDRFYPALQSVLWGGGSVDEALAAALFDTAGEA